MIEATFPLAGRWVIIYQDAGNTFILTDPCGLRQVFYHSDGTHVWCGSQPELIKANCRLSLNADDSLFDLLLRREHMDTESAWVGTQTIYASCYHLLPNHYLDLNRLEQIRFYPTQPVSQRPLSEVVELAAAILRGTMIGIANRYDARFALTAGWDSRVLLAASKDVAGRFEYFVDRMGLLQDDHPDIWVPRTLSRKLNLDFHVVNSSGDIPGWFVGMMSRNVTGARVLPKTRSIYNKFIAGENRLNINGNVSEVCRSILDMHCKLDLRSISSTTAVQLLGYRSVPGFAVNAIEAWRNGLHLDPDARPNILELLHWEQRTGKWGAQYPAEQDIAVEEISPFNNRLLLETMMSTDRTMRCAPDYALQRELIRYMWPEVLSVPINPDPRTRMRRMLDRNWGAYFKKAARSARRAWRGRRKRRTSTPAPF